MKAIKRILFIANDCDLFRQTSGGAVRNNLFVRVLSQIGHVDIISFHQTELVPNIDNCNVVHSEIVRESTHIGWREFLRTWLSMTIKPKDPYSYYKLNEKKASIIDHFVRDVNYDIIACRFVNNAISCGLLKYKERLVIDMDDHPADKLCYLIPQIKQPVIRWKKQYEVKKLRSMIETLLDSVACSFYSSISEKPSSHSIYLHNTINFIEDIPDVNASMEPRILYVGNLLFQPSLYGIVHFTEHIFPLIKEKIPTVKLRIVGKGKDYWIARLNKQTGVEAAGYVEDIISEYKQARVVVVPIYQGTGTSIKFVEALMMNRPLVATPVGSRGFGEICQDGKHYMLAKSDEEFADKTVNLLSSLSTSQIMAKAGCEVVKKNYSQEKFNEIVSESLRTTFLQ
jgi:glycosyltransferase involved in cell wall biosynthesis